MIRLPFIVRLAPFFLGIVACHADPNREPERLRLLGEVPPAHPLPKATTRYALSARLDEKRHEVQGSGTITWTNRSDRQTSEIYLHLYLNAFRKESLFLRGPAGRSGGLVGREGRLDVKRLLSPTFQGVDLWQTAERHSPGDAKDLTDIRVPLPGPIEPGQTLELTVEFLSVLPEIVERTGYSGKYHFVGQWFPKLARLESDGTWAHFPFHAFAEFYADFDAYEVTLDVPDGYHVGATGLLTPLPAVDPGRARMLGRAESIVDFAWTASPTLARETRRFGGVAVHLLMEEGAPAVRRAHWATLEAGLDQLGRWLGEYPYPELTVVVPPDGAERSGGMEYPSLITTGGGEIASRLGIRAVELLVIHELAHQWFQSLVATNEVAFPFLDEGLASYAEWRFLETRYGTGSLASLLGLRLSRTAGGRFAAFYGRDQATAINQPAADFPSFQAIAREVYGRTPLVLETLARTFGRERVDTAIAAYARRERGAHPTPAAFYAELDAYLGETWSSTVRELFDRPGRFNLRVASISRARPVDGELESTLVIERDGGPGLPYQVAVTLEGGEAIVLERSGAEARDTFQVRSKRPIVLVHVDPHERLLLDENPADDRFDPRTGVLPSSAPDGLLTAVASGLALLSFGLEP